MRTPLGETHDAGYRSRNFAIAGRLLRQVFTAFGSELIEPSAPVVGRHTPLTFDPTIQFKALKSGIKRTLFDPQEVVGQLLDELRKRIPMQMTSQQYFQNQHIQRPRQKIGFRSVCSHRLSDYMTDASSLGLPALRK